jgi:hypothetical protein
MFYPLLILFALGGCAFSGSFEVNLTEGQNLGDFLRSNSHGRGPLGPLIAPTEGGAVSEKAEADDGED